MKTFSRNLSLVLALLLFSFPALADNGLASLGDALEELLFIVAWFLGSLVLLAIGMFAYIRRKHPAAAFLIYLSFFSFIMLYLRRLSFFLDNWGSLIHDDSIDSMQKDNAIVSYRILIGLGIVLLGGMITFIVFHIKSIRKRRRY